MKLEIKKLHKESMLPTRGSKEAAGYDLYSNEEVIIDKFSRGVVGTGIAMKIPDGFYGRIAPRSGLAVKRGIDVLAGVVDSDYRGEIRVVIQNLGREAIRFLPKDKIAQMIITPYLAVDIEDVSDLSNTERGEKGFGSTGA